MHGSTPPCGSRRGPFAKATSTRATATVDSHRGPPPPWRLSATMNRSRNCQASPPRPENSPTADGPGISAIRVPRGRIPASGRTVQFDVGAAFGPCRPARLRPPSAALQWLTIGPCAILPNPDSTSSAAAVRRNARLSSTASRSIGSIAMRKNFFAAIATLVCAAAYSQAHAAEPASATTYYVSPKGNDSASGDAPSAPSPPLPAPRPPCASSRSQAPWRRR